MLMRLSRRSLKASSTDCDWRDSSSSSLIALVSSGRPRYERMERLESSELMSRSSSIEYEGRPTVDSTSTHGAGGTSETKTVVQTYGMRARLIERGCCSVGHAVVGHIQLREETLPRSAPVFPPSPVQAPMLTKRNSQSRGEAISNVAVTKMFDSVQGVCAARLCQARSCAC